jgi:hypothetical protein
MTNEEFKQMLGDVLRSMGLVAPYRDTQNYYIPVETCVEAAADGIHIYTHLGPITKDGDLRQALDEMEIQGWIGNVTEQMPPSPAPSDAPESVWCWPDWERGGWMLGGFSVHKQTAIVDTLSGGRLEVPAQAAYVRRDVADREKQAAVQAAKEQAAGRVRRYAEGIRHGETVRPDEFHRVALGKGKIDA